MTVNLDRATALTLAILAATLTLTTAVYWPGLSGPLLLDDMPQLNGLIAASGGDPAELFGNYIVSSSGPLGRPVAMASFIGDAMIHGPNIWWWKLSNLVFHLISGLLVYWLAVLLVRARPNNNYADPRILGAIVAAFWLLHPIHVSTVLYTVQRMTELSTLFVFAGLIAYVKGRLVQESSKAVGWLYIGLGFALFFPLAVFSKENALLYPVYCTLIELFVLQFRGGLRVQRSVKILHGFLLAGYISVAIFGIANFSSVVLDSYAFRDFTLLERLFTEFRVVAVYLSQLLLPVQANLGFFHDDIAVSTSLFEPITTILSALVLTGVIASAFALRKKLPLYAFGVLFFFASHVLESSIIGLELMYEHRNYTGSFGILVAALALVSHAVSNKKGLAIAVVVGLGAFSILTWQRSLTWSSPEDMYVQMYSVHPDSPRLNIVFTNVYASMGDYGRARKALAKVGTGLGPQLHGLFLDCSEHQVVDDGALLKVTQLQDGVVDAHVTSSAQTLVREAAAGRCGVSKQLLVAALDHLLASRTRSITDKQSVLFTKARLLESMNDIDAAVDQYVLANDLSTEDAMPLYLAADMLLRHARADDTRTMLTRAYEQEVRTRMQRKETAQKIYSGLGEHYETDGHFEDALRVYSEATSSMPRRAQFYIDAAELLVQLERFAEAEETLTKARSSKLRDLHESGPEFERIETMLERRRAGSPGNESGIGGEL